MISLSDQQLDQIMTQAHPGCRGAAERLRGTPFADADVWRAAVGAQREIMRAFGPLNVA
jgi:hypothetical protein